MWARDLISAGVALASWSRAGSNFIGVPATTVRNQIGRFAKIDMRAPVAQVDRAAGFEPVGREFESLRARQISEGLFVTGSLRMQG